MVDVSRFRMKYNVKLFLNTKPAYTRNRGKYFPPVQNSPGHFIFDVLFLKFFYKSAQRGLIDIRFKGVFMNTQPLLKCC